MAGGKTETRLKWRKSTLKVWSKSEHPNRKEEPMSLAERGVAV